MQEFIFYETERMESSLTTHNFYIDGFRRQANNTLRRLVLDTFPTISINKKLEHTVSSFEEAFSSGKTVISTLRNPFDSFNSLCGYKNFDPLDTKQINAMIENYIYLHEYLYKNKDNFLFIEFKDIVNSPTKILFYLKNKFLIEKDFIEKYQDIENTPFYNNIKEGELDVHNKTSNFETHEKLSWILQSSYYQEAKRNYDKLFEQRIKLGA